MDVRVEVDDAMRQVRVLLETGPGEVAVLPVDAAERLTVRLQQAVRDAREMERALKAPDKPADAMMAACVNLARDLAEGDCQYGDACMPHVSRHGRCSPCAARKALGRTPAVRP